jgi:hypothetical protein
LVGERAGAAQACTRSARGVVTARIDYDRAAASYDRGRAYPLAVFAEWRQRLGEYLPLQGQAPYSIWEPAPALTQWFGLPVVALEPAAQMRAKAKAKALPPGVPSWPATARPSPSAITAAGQRCCPPSFITLRTSAFAPPSWAGYSKGARRCSSEAPFPAAKTKSPCTDTSRARAESPKHSPPSSKPWQRSPPLASPRRAPTRREARPGGPERIAAAHRITSAHAARPAPNPC